MAHRSQAALRAAHRPRAVPRRALQLQVVLQSQVAHRSQAALRAAHRPRVAPRRALQLQVAHRNQAGLRPAHQFRVALQSQAAQRPAHRFQVVPRRALQFRVAPRLLSRPRRQSQQLRKPKLRLRPRRQPRVLRFRVAHARAHLSQVALRRQLQPPSRRPRKPLLPRTPLLRLRPPSPSSQQLSSRRPHPVPRFRVAHARALRFQVARARQSRPLAPLPRQPRKPRLRKHLPSQRRSRLRNSQRLPKSGRRKKPPPPSRLLMLLPRRRRHRRQALRTFRATSTEFRCQDQRDVSNAR